MVNYIICFKPTMQPPGYGIGIDSLLVSSLRSQMVGASKCKINMLAIFLVLPVSKGYLSVQGTNIQLRPCKTQKSDFFFKFWHLFLN